MSKKPSPKLLRVRNPWLAGARYIFEMASTLLPCPYQKNGGAYE